MSWPKKILALHERMTTPYVRVDDPEFADWPDITQPSRSLNRSQMIAAIELKNPRRWRRLISDFRWAQGEMERLGRNPEDARFLL